MNSQSFFLTHVQNILSHQKTVADCGKKSRQQLPLFLARDYNASFTQSFEEKTFAKLTPDEMNIFSSRRIFQSFCEVCQKFHFKSYSTLHNTKKSGDSVSATAS